MDVIRDGTAKSCNGSSKAHSEWMLKMKRPNRRIRNLFSLKLSSFNLLQLLLQVPGPNTSNPASSSVQLDNSIKPAPVMVTRVTSTDKPVSNFPSAIKVNIKHKLNSNNSPRDIIINLSSAPPSSFPSASPHLNRNTYRSRNPWRCRLVLLLRFHSNMGVPSLLKVLLRIII